MRGTISSLSSASGHAFKKTSRQAVRLLEGLGIEGDAHCGATVKHRSRVAIDPSQPNLRQVHLIHGELHDEPRAAGFAVAPGDMGENITTRGLDLLALPVDALLRVGTDAVLRITGLRNPCRQLNRFAPGLMAAVLGRDAHGGLIRKAGIMAIVQRGGEVRVGDALIVELPAPPLRALDRV